MNKKQQNNRGFALLLSLIISSIALSIGLSMLHITLKQLTLGSTTLGSEIAFQVTNAGMECLRYMRNLESDTFVAGNPVTFDCLGFTGEVTPTEITPNVLFQYRKSDIDWNPSGENLCVDIELYVVDASGGFDVAHTFPNGSKICSAGDVCTFGFVRGYNRSCGEIATSIFTVQRELTVEF